MYHTDVTQKTNCSGYVTLPIFSFISSAMWILRGELCTIYLKQVFSHQYHIDYSRSLGIIMKTTFSIYKTFLQHISTIPIWYVKLEESLNSASPKCKLTIIHHFETLGYFSLYISSRALLVNNEQEELIEVYCPEEKNRKKTHENNFVIKLTG